MDRRIGSASAVMRALYRSVVVKREQSQNLLKGLYISYGLRMPWDPLGGTGECCWEEEFWGPCLARCHHDTAPDKRKKMDGWVEAIRLQ